MRMQHCGCSCGVFFIIYIYYTEQNGATYIYGRFDCYSVVSLYILLYLSCPENTRIVLICDASSLAIKPFSYDSFCWERGGILGLPKLILPVSFLEPRNFSFHFICFQKEGVIITSTSV